jgi:very-short-patch-repair endonuclease
VDELVDAIETRGGVVHVRTLRASGFRKDRIERAVESGNLLRVRRGVYASPAAPADLIRAARVGGRLAGASATVLHGLWVPPHRNLVVEVPRGANRLLHPDVPGRTLTAADLVDLLWTRESRPAADRIGLSPLQDCIVQCFRALPSSWATAVLDSAVRTGTVDSIELAAIRLGIPRTFGRITRLVDGRCESGWEFVLRSELALVGIEARPQVRVPGTDLDRFDLLVGDRLVIEVDSELHHGDRQARRRDRRRDAMVTALGFLVLRFDAVMIETELDDVLASVRRYVESGLHLTRR